MAHTEETRSQQKSLGKIPDICQHFNSQWANSFILGPAPSSHTFKKNQDGSSKNSDLEASKLQKRAVDVTAAHVFNRFFTVAMETQKPFNIWRVKHSGDASVDEGKVHSWAREKTFSPLPVNCITHLDVSEISVIDSFWLSKRIKKSFSCCSFTVSVYSNAHQQMLELRDPHTDWLIDFLSPDWWRGPITHLIKEGVKETRK